MYLNVLKKESDKRKIEKIFRENKQRCYWIAYKILQDTSDAEKAVCAGFLKVAGSFSLYRHESHEKLGELCCTLVRHEAARTAGVQAQKEAAKKKPDTGKEKALDLTRDIFPDITSENLEQLLAQFAPDLITGAILQLDDGERELLNLQYGLELSAEEVGKLFDEPTESVRKRMLRCRNKLAKPLEDWV